MCKRTQGMAKDMLILSQDKKYKKNWSVSREDQFSLYSINKHFLKSS